MYGTGSSDLARLTRLNSHIQGSSNALSSSLCVVILVELHHGITHAGKLRGGQGFTPRPIYTAGIGDQNTAKPVLFCHKRLSEVPYLQR